MAGVEGIEQGARLDSAHFAENDPVRSPQKGGFQKIIERDAGLERVGLAFGRHNVRLLDVKLGGIFDDHDAIVIRNEVSQYPQKRGLPGPGPPVKGKVLPVRICSPKKSASCRVSVPRAIRSSIV